jgi:hypothetical protein
LILVALESHQVTNKLRDGIPYPVHLFNGVKNSYLSRALRAMNLLFSWIAADSRSLARKRRGFGMSRAVLFGFRRIFVQQLAVGVAARDAALLGGELQGFLAVKLCLVH